MRKINNIEIKEICKAYEELGSLRKVSRKFNRSIGTIHKYIPNHSLFKSQNIIKRTYSDDERLIGTYVGLWMGDGTQFYENRYTIKICSNKNDKILNNFYQKILQRLFQKKTCLLEEKSTNRAYVKFYSKFIFDFIYKYVKYENKKKTSTVRLRKNIEEYNNDFLEGCLLGLALSDGFLKNRFKFNVISDKLSENMYNILKRFKFNPSCYIHKRKKYGWKDLHMTSLNVNESKLLLRLLDKIIKKIGFNYSFKELKYGPAQI